MKILGLIGILLIFLIPASYAQNTKGDKTQTQRIDKRENRVGLSKKKKTKNKNSYNRVQGRGPSQANRAIASKPPKIYPQKTPPSVTAKFKKQNIRSSGATSNSRSVSGQQPKSRSTRVQARSATGSIRNVYPQGQFKNYSSKRSTENAYSNRQEVARTSRMSFKPNPPKRRRVTPSSASRSYISRRSINAFAGFWNKKPKGEKAYEGDISGRKLRTKNFETKRPVFTNPTARPYQPKKRVGDKPYKVRAGGTYVTATRSGKAWRGDIAGRRLRARNFTSKKRIERVGQQGGGYQSVTGNFKKSQGRLPGRPPGKGAAGIDTYQGDMRGGKVFSPQGETYTGNIKGRKIFSPQGETYTGNIKSRRPLKGGGSVSGERWNNNGQAIAGKSPGKGSMRVGSYQGDIKGGRKLFAPQGETYTGNMKAQKPVKGGGSVSGKVWNNNGQAIAGKSPGKGADRVGTYQGNIRGGKKIFTPQGADFTGNIKATKPVKGGGSVSGKLWNNNEQPIAGKAPSKRIRMDLYQGNLKLSKQEPSKDIGGFPGKHHEFDFHPSYQNQGEEFTGHTRLPRFKKEYIQNPNSSKESLKKTRPDKTTYLVDGLQIKVKQKDYKKKPNAAENAMRGIAPDKTTYLVDGLQVKIKQQDYKKKPNAAENAMRGIGPGSGSIKASEFTKAMKQTWSYKHNPNAADDALDSHEPGKAFARATDYQGNIKMRKVIFGKKGLHPDAQFVKINKNNVDDERDMLTNFKLWWAKLFKKNDTQPDHLKEKYRKPRYDKREEGLWYD